jgi:predicted ATPase/DNA-binding SARP family transcriptional activator/Tfp pilus assembly protein PilF
MKRLSLFLLGPYDAILGEDQVTDFRSDKIRALLAYLAVEADRPHRREALAGLLWPDVPDRIARQNLRLSLHRLRDALSDRGAESDYFKITRESIQAKPQALSVDVSLFNRLLEETRSHVHDHLATCQACADRLKQAAEWYRGDFLQGFFLDDSLAFAEWSIIRKEWLHRQALWVLEQLTLYHQRRRELRAAERYARRQLELEPWREKAHLQLIEIMARRGETSAALAQYQICRQVLAEELGVEPGHDTERLYERVQLMRASPAHNLPPQATPFVGREQELARLDAMLSDPDIRLVTIVGAGGMGKTRLAIQAGQATVTGPARQFLHGVIHVPLADVESAEFLAPAIAGSLNLPLHGPDEPIQQLLDFLEHREMLLLLDNFEHLLDGTGLLVTLMQKAPGVKLLVTSRERLNLHWEWLLPLEGLSYPRNKAASAPLGGQCYDAVRLFQACAQRVCPDFQLTEEVEQATLDLCAAVEGMPLGIELAAAWVRIRSVEEIAQEIAQDLDLSAASSRSMPARHRSLRAVFDYSWRRLTSIERTVLGQLSVFRGGFDAAAAGKVASASPQVLQALVDKSLLRFSTLGRYDVHELLRQFAAEQLPPQTTAQQALQDRHSAYYLAFLAQQEPGMNRPGAIDTLMVIDAEVANIRAAWRWAVERADVGCLAQALTALAGFYRLKGPLQEGTRLIGSAVAQLQQGAVEGAAPAQEEAPLLGRLLAAQAGLLNRQSLYDEAATAAQQATFLAEEQGTTVLEAAARLGWGEALWRQGVFDGAQVQFERALRAAQAARATREEAESMRSLGVLCFDQGDFARARGYYEKALALCQASGDWREEGASQNNIGLVLWQQGKLGQARVFFEQALSRCRAMGDRHTEGLILHNLGRVLLQRGEYGPARDYLEQALQLNHDMGHRIHEGWGLLNLGRIAMGQDDCFQAQRFFEQALRIFGEIKARQGEALALVNLGGIARQQGQYREAMVCLQRALRISREIHDRQSESWALSYLGQTLANQGAYERARDCLAQAIAISREIGDRQSEGWELLSMGLVAHHRGEVDAAQALAEQALQIAAALEDRSQRATALTQLGHGLAARADLVQAEHAYQRAVDLRRALAQPHATLESLAGVARVAIARDDLHAAMATVEQIMLHLETASDARRKGHGLEGADEPLRVYLTCYRVLHAAGDARAQDLLNSAHDWLQQQAAAISDAGLRRSFLENVPAHREILAEIKRC